MSDNKTNSSSGGKPIQGLDLGKEASRLLEEQQKASAASVNNLVSVHKEDDGKTYWLGIEVSPEMAPLLATVTSGIQPFISGALGKKSYDLGENLFTKFNHEFKFTENPLASHKFGLGMAAAAVGTLIAIQPTMEVVQAIKKKNEQKQAILENLAPIVDSNKDGYKNNEVIKTALEKTHKTMVQGFKHAAGELPAVIANGYFAVHDHKALAIEKTLKAEAALPKDTSKDALIKFTQAKLEEERDLALVKKDFVRLNKGKKTPDGKKEEKDWENYFDKIQNERKETEKQKEIHGSKNDGEAKIAGVDINVKQFVGTGAALVSAFVKQGISKNNKDEKKKPCAYELIMQLQGKFGNGDIRKGTDLSKQVMEAFQQNELDRGRPKFGEVLVEKLEPLTKRIAEVISNGELEPLSLVNFVGDGRVSNKRHFVSLDDLEKLIDDQRKFFGSNEKKPLDELLANFADPKLLMAGIKSTLQSLQGMERAMFAALLPKSALQASGLSDEEILPLLTQGHDGIYEVVKNQAQILAQKTDEELKEQEFSEKQIKSIKSLNELISKGAEKEKDVKAAIEGSDSKATDAVRAELLKGMIATTDKAGYWTAKFAERPTKKPADIIKDREGEQDMPKAEVIAHQAAQNHNHSGHHQRAN